MLSGQLPRRHVLVFFIFALCSLCPLWLCGRLRAAALDAEVNVPYHLTVVLHVAKHPLLTDVFKEQVLRELRDGLQAAFGNMGVVKVVDRHPLLPEIERHGLGQPLGGGEAADAKTHFVLIDFVNGQYEVRARQHDGLTGLDSPVTRRDRTADRQYVARLATLLIDQDLGVVGTLEEHPKGDDAVHVTLKGSGLGQPMDRWVAPGDVFAVVRVSRAGNAWRAQREEWALLKVKEGPDKDGVCVCQFFHRYQNPLRGGSAYRCIKLGTTTAPLRLRLLNLKNHQPLSKVFVSFSHTGFDSDKKADDLPDQEGYVAAPEPFTNIAFVRVSSGEGGQLLAKIPIEITGERTVVCEIETNPGAENRGRYLQHKRAFDRHVEEGILTADTLFRELGPLEKKDVAKALEKARSGLAELQTEIQRRSDDLSGLRKEMAELQQSDPALTNAGVRALQKQAALLEDHLKQLEEVHRQRNDPRRLLLQAKVTQAHQNYGAAEFDEAIEAYREVVRLAEETKEPKILEEAKKRLQELQAWTPKNDEHKQAQNFIKAEWPNQEAAKLDVARARRMFEICKKNNDKLTPQRLLQVNLVHIKRLRQLLESPDVLRDKERLEDLSKIAADLRQLTDDALAYVNPEKAKAGDEETEKD